MIKREQLFRLAREVKLRHGAAACVFTAGAAVHPVRHEPVQRIAQSARVAGRHAFPAAVSEIRARADVRHNERQTAFHRFERGKAHGLVIQRAAHVGIRGTHQRFGVRAVARADDVFVKALLTDALAHGVKKLSVARDETSKRSVRALLELRKRVQQEEKPLFGA